MASTSPPTCLKALNSKHYILAVLMATLAAAVVVTVFFVVLSPARIYFSVTNPSSNVSRDDSVDLVLTLAANNTSQRAAAWYKTILVDVTNDTGTSVSPASIWTRAVITNTSAIMSQWQPHGSVVTVDATVWVAPEDPWTTPFIAARRRRADMHSSTNYNFSVRVTAVARFKVGFARTRLYDIKVICSPVSFLPQQNRRRGSAAASAAHVLPPVACEPN
jgi:hypothetical protein